MERAHRPSAITAKSTGPQPTVEISPDNTTVTAKLPTGQSVVVLLHGATVTSWKHGSEERLWLSEKAILDGSKPVRGGIPLVFPVFGPPPKGHATSALPQHGFARNSKWEFLGKSTSESGTLASGGDDSVKLDFGLDTSTLTEDSRKAWPHDFSLVYSVTLGIDGLRTALTVNNRGDKPFDFQMLFHSYFRVKQITTTSIRGLLGTSYVDKVLNASEHVESSHDLKISSEVDRVYKSLKQDTTTITEDGSPRLDVVRDNLNDTVIWNPWTEKAAGMGDFAPKAGFHNMVCVEVGSVEGWQTLEPGETFVGGQLMRPVS